MCSCDPLRAAGNHESRYDASDVTRNKGALSPHSEREELILYNVRAHLEAGVTDHEQIVAEWARRWGGVHRAQSQTTLGLDIGRSAEGVIGFHVRLTSATDWDKLARMGWIKPEFAKYRAHFHDAHKVRPRWPDPARIIAVLGAFYLSRSGGGERDRQAAWDLLCAVVPDVSAESMSEHHKLLAQIRNDFGPLVTDEQSRQSA